MRKAIIFGTGGLCGAYSAGFAAELCRRTDSDYFNSIYGISVGTTIASFLLSNQPETIENTWRNRVSGNKLIKPYNFLLGRKLLDLDYLISLFDNGIAHLNLDKVMGHRERLNFAIINYDTGKVSWAKPDKENIFQLMMAACSMPIVRGPQLMGNEKFFDAGFVYGGIPKLERIAKEHDNVIYVSNYPRDYQMSVGWELFTDTFFPIAAKLAYPKPLQRVFQKRKQVRKESLEYMEANPKFRTFFPEKRVFNSTFDTSKEKINLMINLGREDAKSLIII